VQCRKELRRYASSFPALAKVLPQAIYELLRRDIKSHTDTQECGHRNGSAGLNQLIVTEAEPIRNHVFLSELALRSERPDAMA
jgi:hypothetical protein